MRGSILWGEARVGVRDQTVQNLVDHLNIFDLHLKVVGKHCSILTGGIWEDNMGQ